MTTWESTSNPTTSGRPPSLPARVGAALLGASILLTSALFTLGTSLAAPIGAWLARSLARRRGKHVSRWTSWIGAAVASTVALIVVVAAFLAVAPEVRQSFLEVATAAPTAQQAPPPPWLSRILPQATKPSPMTERLFQSRWVTGYIALVTVALMFAIYGAIAGSLGWAGGSLLGYAFRRARPG